LRGAICSYHVNEQDNVRRAYISMGPYQPKLKDKEYSCSLYGKQYRRFQYSWQSFLFSMFFFLTVIHQNFWYLMLKDLEIEKGLMKKMPICYS